MTNTKRSRANKRAQTSLKDVRAVALTFIESGG